MENIVDKLHIKMKILKYIMVKNHILCNAPIIKMMDLELLLNKYIHKMINLLNYY